jgi:D-alanyl-D-alanine carboxypeptidase (penicillin-binding protein 5/6)
VNKKIIINILLVVFIVLNLFSFNSFADGLIEDVDTAEYDAVTVIKIMDKTNIMELKARSSLLMDAETGTVLLEKDSHERLPMASVTKVMSMLLFMEAIDSGKFGYDDMVTTSEYAAGMGGSQAYIEPGEEFTVRDALKAIAIHSSNDVTVALAEKVSGSEEVFVAAMNRKAEELGMNDTKFKDTTGLTEDDHYSSAYDIAVMSRELVNKHPGILEFTRIWQDKFRNGEFSLDNTNKLVKFYNGADGLKTGFISKAGYCLSATAKRGDMRLISVVLGEPDSNTRFAESRKLLDYGFANFEISQVNQKGEEVGVVDVRKGMKSNVTVVYPDDVKLLLNKGEKGNITREVKPEETITAPIQQGQKVGEVIFAINEKEVRRVDLVAGSEVEKASFTRLFIRLIGRWFRLGRK